MSNDYYQTPPYLWGVVHEVFFLEDVFDPCPANPDFDGLSVSWGDFAYINPPFSQYKHWVEHGLQQRGEQIWMAHTNNATSWYQRLLNAASAVCLFNHRICFINPETGYPDTQPRQHSSAIYVGGRPDRFAEGFSQHGTVLLTRKSPL